jgi:hypothetical protein
MKKKKRSLAENRSREKLQRKARSDMEPYIIHLLKFKKASSIHEEIEQKEMVRTEWFVPPRPLCVAGCA